MRLASSSDMLDPDEQSLVVATAIRAARTWPWYASRLAQSGFFDEPTFERVPVITQADIDAGYSVADVDDGTDRSQGRLFATSGTSTGRSRNVFWPRADDVRYVAQ